MDDSVKIRASRLLTEDVIDSRDVAYSRTGITLSTSRGELLEAAGGSHATTIVHDGGSIIKNALDRYSSADFALTGRTVRHRAQEELADLICQRFGDPEARVFFTSGGTEAVETAIRLAWHIQSLRGREHGTIVIGRVLSYHGMSLLARNVGQHPIHSALPQELNLNWPKLLEPRCLRCPLKLSFDSCSFECVTQLESIIQRTGRDKIAAVIVEPISGSTGGALVPPEKYFHRLSAICRSNGILLIADEIVTAFGRIGKHFAANSDAVDIVVGGKALAGGFAAINSVILSSAVCTELANSRTRLPLRLTFSGPPLTCLIAICVQDYVQRNGLVERVSRHSAQIELLLKKLAARALPEAIINGIGHLWSVEVPTESGTGDQLCRALRLAAKDLGVEYMGGCKPGEDADFVHLMLTPAFDAQDDEIGHAAEGIFKVFRKGISGQQEVAID